MTSAPPPPGYGYYPAQPPPGWQPPQRPADGAASLATAILTGIFAVPALIVVLVSGHDAALCNSGLGQIGQALDQTTARNCAAVNGVHVIAVVALVVLAAGCLIATLVHVSRQRPPVPSGWPGWVPPQPPPGWQGPPTSAPPPPRYREPGQRDGP